MAIPPKLDRGRYDRSLALTAQDGPDTREEHARAEGLGHVVGSAELEPGHDIGLLPFGTQDEDGDVLRLGVVLEDAAHFEPIEPGEHEVEDDDPGRLGARLPQGVFTGLHAGDGEAVLAQVVLDQLEDVSLVVNDEHTLFGHHTLRVRSRGGPRAAL